MYRTNFLGVCAQSLLFGSHFASFFKLINRLIGVPWCEKDSRKAYQQGKRFFNITRNILPHFCVILFKVFTKSANLGAFC